MIQHTFVYNGMLSSDYGLVLSGEDTWTRAQPDVQRISVPGRNGDIILPGNRFKNMDITYHCGIIRDMRRNFDALAERLGASPGYYRLEDSYHPESFRLASFESALTPDVHERGMYATVDITFNCSPQRYLKSGEHWITLVGDGIIYNPTAYVALPRFRFHPGVNTGKIFIGGAYIYVPRLQSLAELEIDCETEEVMVAKSRKPVNDQLVFEGYRFPRLFPGDNFIRAIGVQLGEIRIYPRWWTI